MIFYKDGVNSMCSQQEEMPYYLKEADDVVKEVTHETTEFLYKIPDFVFTHGEVKKYPTIIIKEKLLENHNKNKDKNNKNNNNENDKDNKNLKRKHKDNNKNNKKIKRIHIDENTCSSVDVMNPSFESLVNLGNWGAFGKGEETVTDFKVRRVLELKNTQLEVHWEQLEEVLQEVSDKLMPGYKLRATFYKLLIYRQGDFFLTHIDSKRSASHVLTLAVNCGYTCSEPPQGGEVYLYSTNDKNNITIWESMSEWACWHTQLFHGVNEVKSGVRVIAMYDVLVEGKIDQKVKVDEVSGQVFPDEIWLNIASFCGSVYLLSQVSKQLSVLINTEFIIKNRIADSIEVVRPYLNALGMKYFGFVLAHNYAFSEFVPPLSLIGADRKLFNALQLLNLPVKIEECKLVVIEHSKTMSGIGQRGRFGGYRIAKDIVELKEFCSFQEKWYFRRKKEELSAVEVPKQYQTLFNNKKSINPMLLNVEQTLYEYGEGENERGPRGFPVPFLGVVWFSSFRLLSRRKTRCDEQLGTNMYGNQAHFSQFWYKTSVLLLEIDEEVVDENAMWGRDFTRYDDHFVDEENYDSDVVYY